VALIALRGLGGLHSGRGIGRFFLFRALLHLFGRTWGTVVIFVLIAAIVLGLWALQQRQRR
jgi:hypothetical protein